MDIQYAQPRPEHIPELGRILFEAFANFQTRHGFPPDFPSVEVATQVMGMLIGSGKFCGVVAMKDGRPIGSNFMSLLGEVGGVGPITVDAQQQSAGVGRGLMQAVVDYATKNNIARVRLVQDAHNTASLSLYTSLGFDWRESLALFQLTSAGDTDPTVRTVNESDLNAMRELSKSIYRVDRSGHIAFATAGGMTPLVRVREGKIVAYLIPSFFGHGVAQTHDDMLALSAEVGRKLPPDMARCFCPLGDSKLFRGLVGIGGRVIKTMNLMSIGPYERPSNVWMPSIEF